MIKPFLIEFSSNDEESTGEQYFCPVCGHKFFETFEDDYESDECAHIIFVYETLSPDYLFKSSDYDERLTALADEMLEDEIDELLFDDQLAAMGYGEDVVIAAVEFTGIACGPVSHSLVFGFNFQGHIPDKIELENIPGNVIITGDEE